MIAVLTLSNIVLSSGFVNIVWVDETFRIDTDRDLMFNRWDEDLSSWSGTELLNDYITLTYMYTDITLDLEGNIHVVSRANGADATTDNIYQLIYYKWDSISQNWLTPLQINYERAGYINYPSITSDGIGNTYVGWDQGGTNDYDVMFRFYDISISSWSTEETISSPEINNPRAFSLAVDGLGHIHAVWYNDFEYLSSGSDRDIFYRKLIGPPETPKLAPIVPIISELSNVYLFCANSYGATTYHIYMTTQPILSLEGLVPIITTIDTDYIDSLPSEDIYFYAVVASNFAGNSSVSNCEFIEYKLPTLFEYLFPIGLTVSLACIVTFAIFLRRRKSS